MPHPERAPSPSDPAPDTPQPLVLRTVPRPPAARRLAGAFFRDVVGSLRNGVVVITRRGVLAHMNREAYRILGLTPAASDVGGRYVEVLRACPEVVRILRSAFELTNPPNRAELRLRSSGRVIGYTVCPVKDAQGTLIGATLLFKDLTRVEQLEERERLRDRLAALGEMAAAIAHEVKNPLAGIKVMAGLLKRRVAGVPDAEALLNDIINEAKMADAIVVETLEFVRPIRLQVEPVLLERVVSDALRVAEDRVGRSGIDVSVSLPDDLPPLEADAGQLRQLFTNLLANAFEAIEQGGRVRIEAALQGAEVDPDSLGNAYLPPTIAISVIDSGPGVPEEIRDRVFSPFFTTKARGSGLGLAIVRKIVDAHDGRIDLVVGAEGGTCFRVTLPLVIAHEAASPFAREPLAQTGT
jgi:two-component system nitrogen regulation sensor histidine kinase GlnL